MPKIIENVREQLLCEAKRQIAERGYANTTIRSVAGECGLAVGTVYNYFKSKDMLIASFMAEDWHKCTEKIKNCPTNDKKTFLRCIYESLSDYSDKHKMLFDDADAAKVFASVFSVRHTQLRDQIAAFILPICEADNAEFVSDFAAESIICWTMAGVDFEELYNVIKKNNYIKGVRK